MQPFRPLEAQFGPEKAARINAVIGAIDGLCLVEGPERLYAWELQRCLRAGLLLAALHVAASLVELRVRQLVLLHRLRTASGADAFDVQRRLEDDRKAGFKSLLDELKAAGLLADAEVQIARRFYDTVRIPIHHATVARYASARKQTAWTEMVRSDLVLQDFEGAIEESAVDEIDEVIALLSRHTASPAAPPARAEQRDR